MVQEVTVLICSPAFFAAELLLYFSVQILLLNPGANVSKARMEANGKKGKKKDL